MKPRAPLHALLFLTAAVPALAFLWGTREGEVAFVLYREPKLAALQILGWCLLAALAWRQPHGLQVADALASLRRPAWWLLALFVAWGLVTALWVEVRENLVLELRQYVLLALLVLALDAWAGRDPAVPRIVEAALVLSAGAATLVGLLQAALPFAVLSPIDPVSSLGGPSFLGYKNPMALALVGQIFLLVRLLARTGPGRGRRLLIGLLAAELIHLATLNSRTSWVALFGAAAGLGVLLAVREGLGRRTWRIAAVSGAAAALFLAVLAADPVGRKRVPTVIGYLAHPASFLQSDRGTYLRDTLAMVRDHPLGVGLGDWQTAYPLYQSDLRRLGIPDSVPVRKAHGDYVQCLGETGWPGLALWLGFVGALLAAPAAHYLRSGDRQSLYAAGQVAALAIAMLTDSVVEHPYGKLQFLLVGVLAVRAATGRAQEKPVHSTEPVRPFRGSIACAAALTFVAAMVTFSAIATTAKAFFAARMVDLYLEAEESPAAGAQALLKRAVEAGEIFAHLPGHTKEFCDDDLVLAQAELLLGHREKALIDIQRSVRLHPHNPEAQRFLSTYRITRRKYGGANDVRIDFLPVPSLAQPGHLPRVSRRLCIKPFLGG